MSRWWRAWVALMDRREAPTALALVRISVALVLIGTVGVVASLHATLPVIPRLVLGGLSLVVIGYPDKLVAAGVAIVIRR